MAEFNADVAAPPQTAQTVQSDQSPRRVWDDAPLRSKLTVMVLTAVVGGTVIGVIEAQAGYQFWPLCLGLTVLASTLIALSHQWLAAPLDRLLGVAAKLEPAAKVKNAQVLQSLPVERRDEVGQLARLIQKVATKAVHCDYEAKRLRRTLDHRVAEQTRKATRKLERMSMRDPMTDLGNRRFLDEHLEPLLQSVLASGCDLICMVLDIDNFKQVNDTQGHAAGDDLIIFLGQLIRGTCREEDYTVRLGGDEFVVLMPDCHFDRACTLASQLRSLLRQHGQRTLPPDHAIDLSIGVASLRRDGATTGKALLQVADANLYDAKRAGKGRTVGVLSLIRTDPMDAH